MSIKVMSMIFDRYPGGGGDLLLALAIADHAHDDGTNIYPSIKSLSKKTRQSERTVQYQLRKMEESGWIQLVSYEKGGRGKSREYRINPDWIMGADIAPFSIDIKGATDDIKGATDDIKGATDDIKGAIAVAPEPSLTITNHQETSEDVFLVSSEIKKSKTRKPQLTLDEYINRCKENNQSPIPDDDPIFSYIKKVGIPLDYLYLGWKQFKKKKGGGKKQADWPKTFRNYVEFGWLQIWAIDKDGQCVLTTAGKQLEREVA